MSFIKTKWNVLGPLLFLVYTYGIFGLDLDAELIYFADNTLVLVNGDQNR